MKKKIKKIYLPKWQRYFIIPFFIFLWLFIGYMEFFSAEAGEMGTVGFLFATALFLGVMVMLWLMTSGKLPAYTMEEEVNDEDDTTSNHNQM